MESIPVAQPIVNEPVARPLIPTQEPTLQICKTCSEPFYRKEEDKMTSRYFRCEDCINKQVSRGILANCTLQ